MEPINKKILFVGAGNMAFAIASGLIKSNVTQAENILCFDINKNAEIDFKNKLGVNSKQDLSDAVSFVDIIFLSVKPQNISEVLEAVKSFINIKTLIISIAAGITTQFIEHYLGGEIPVVRVMPNTPALVLCAMSVLCKGKHACKKDVETAKILFDAIGKTEILEEKYFDAVTALSGSGPAYVFYLCELMQKAGEKLGINADISKNLAIQTIYGAGKMLSISEDSPEILKEKVKSPKGTTEAALTVFKNADFETIVANAMQRAADRSRELRK
ncbi:MAG: pyrroline-5-carboxylate reductase [Elusimicrobiota bacterium]|jgi:pyrroline-5-carboxylate reductase|nr:pyrroline-5-carboxylate reductase [Elusimicrobiota bacterium]